MRKQNRKRNIWGRRIAVLVLLCGLLLPIFPQTNAASVTYVYNWIQDESGLPGNDGQWHDFFIAWEDTDDEDKVWFTDYHWYTSDGYNNYDTGGTHWMEYKAASTLEDTTSTSFTSEECLGHMQIKYAGLDGWANFAPKYYIRVSRMNGGYIYLTQYEPSSNEADADTFTFEDHGDVFHIFHSVGGKADRYLTRNGQYLETTESTSYGGGDYWRPLRVYERTFVTNEEDNGNADVIGKTTLYEYTWVNDLETLMALAQNKQWVDIALAWEDCNGGDAEDNNPNKVWYTKEIWEEDGNPNYETNDSGNEFYYWSNDYWGTDGYSSPYADQFLLPSKASHFQLRCVGSDGDNPVLGVTDEKGQKINSPMFEFRFEVANNTYIYLGNNGFEENPDDAEQFTAQLRLEANKKSDPSYYYGSMYIFVNITADQDEYLTRKENRFDISNWIPSKYWEFPFRIYTCTAIEYDAIVKSFTIGKGATYSIDRQLIVEEGVTITVEDGGVLIVDRELLNNGKIVVKNGGTVIVNEGGYIMSYDPNVDETIAISLDGGNLIIMDGAKVICDQGWGAVEAKNGATILNRGLLMVGRKLIINNNSHLTNETDARLFVGGRIGRERGSIGVLTFDEIYSCMEIDTFSYLISNKSKIINKGLIKQPPAWYTSYCDDAEESIYNRINGQISSHRSS